MNTPLDNLTKEDKREFFATHILDLISIGALPKIIYRNNGAGLRLYYLLGELPYGRFALYSEGEVTVITGFNEHGTPLTSDNISFKQHSTKKLFRQRYNTQEKDLILKVKELLSYHRGNSGLL